MFAVRRVLAALVVVVATLTVPEAARSERPAPPVTPPASPVRPAAPGHPVAGHLLPGRIALGPVSSAEEWFHGFRAAVAGTGAPAREVLAPEPARSAAADEDEIADRIYVFVVDDLDGDRASDLVRYRSVYEGAVSSADGFTELTVYSGRTGAYRWRRRVDGLALAQPIVMKVGRGGATGIVLIRAETVSRPWSLDDVTRLDPLRLLFPDQERRVRVVGITNRGRIAYDKRFTTEDGKGDIQFGGTFDAYPGHGDELLFGRVKRTLPGVLYAHAVTVDGYDGTIREVSGVELVLAQSAGYIAAGDIDRDRRDDVLEIRGLAPNLGEVVARSVVEERTLWTAANLPIGEWVWLGGTADVTGDRLHDVVVNSRTRLSGLTIGGVPPEALVELLPKYGTHGLLLDGRGGRLAWDRLDGEEGSFDVWDDVNRDGKRDVLSVVGFDGERDGIRMTAVTGTNRELYRREVTVPRPTGDDQYGFVYAMAGRAGHLDRDRVTDVAFWVASASLAFDNERTGLFLAGSNRARITTDRPFGATLDGGTDERLAASYTNTVVAPYTRWAAAFTVADGWNGRGYWRVRTDTLVASPRHFAYWALEPLPGARGRCAGAVLFGAAPGAVWVDVLDGATGRIRWSKTFFGTRPATNVRTDGRRAACR